MDGNADTVTFQATELLRSDHHRFDIPLGVTRSERYAVNDDFDDASAENIAALLAKANDLVEHQRARIEAVAHLLRKPRDEIDLEGALTR